MAGHDTAAADAEEATRLEQVIAEHDLLKEAKGRFHCAGPDLMRWTEAEITRTKLDDAVKKSIVAHLDSDDSSVRILMYFTSAVTPEPLSGYGELYAFMFHPERDELIETDVSTWRS